MGRAVDTDGTGSLFFPLCAVVLAQQSIDFPAGDVSCSRSPAVMSYAYQQMRLNGFTMSCHSGYGTSV